MINETSGDDKQEQVVAVREEISGGENPPSLLPCSPDIDPSCYRYDDNKCFYRDPKNGTEYEWKEDQKGWVLHRERGAPDGPPDISKDYVFDGKTYTYTDKNSKVQYIWDTDKNEWVVKEREGDTAQASDEEEFDDDDEAGTSKVARRVRQDMTQGVYGHDGESHTYTDARDGTVYIWDKEKNAWFPKVDDDFLAKYQMSYGFNTPETAAPVPKKEEEEKPVPKPEPAKKKDPTWFEVDERSNTKVYVSGLPPDTTEEVFVDLMQKCGLVMKDPDSGKMKVKLYTEPGTRIFKGDALCTYIKVESVELALKILDGYDFKGKKIKVERAKFTMKGGAYDPSLKPKKKRKKDLDKIRKMQEKLFDWRPEKMRGERERHERVVVVKNLFGAGLFDKDVGLILEYQEDLRQECVKCGEVKRVTIHDRHPEGVAQVFFKEAEAADACVQLLNNRWFGQRRLSALTWDGKTKYKVAETEEEAKERLKKWEKYIQEGDKSREEGGALKKTSTPEEDSGDETRSSAGSGDDTDEEAVAASKKPRQDPLTGDDGHPPHGDDGHPPQSS